MASREGCSLRTGSPKPQCQGTAWPGDRPPPQPCSDVGLSHTCPQSHSPARPHIPGAQPAELMLGGSPCPSSRVAGARATWLCEAGTKVPQPRTRTLTAVPWDRAGASCRSPPLAPPAQPAQLLNLSVSICGFIPLPHSPSVASEPAQTSAIHFCTDLSMLLPSALSSWVTAFLFSCSSVPCPPCASSALTAWLVLRS